jgi:RimJ/RimL family protein N-acetyltransferase
MTSLETARLRLRRFKKSDLDNLSELESNPEIIKWTPMRVPLSREQSQTRLEGILNNEAARAPLGIWAVEEKASQDFVGWFMLIKREAHDPDPELGFMIVQRQWGKGYATEAAACLVSYAFNVLAFPKVIAVTDERNENSKQVLLKLGFKKVRNADQLDFFELLK